MMNLKAGILLCIVGFTFASISSEFIKTEVVPDVIKIAPKDEVEVDYGKKEVKFDDELTPSQTKNIPKIDYEDQNDSLYTLIMTDPDAPSRQNPTSREFLHWLVVNIPDDKISKGEILAPYRPPGPPKGTGFHRYVFLVFEQPGKITFDESHLTSNGTNGRRKFSTKKFAEKYNLGNAVAGNMFRAQWDESVSK